MLSNEKVESQARAAGEAVVALLPDVLRGGLPADRRLAGYFRDNRRFGSRDRRLISELFYAGFRWWGWTRTVAPPGLGRLFDWAAQAGSSNESPVDRLASYGLTPWLLATAMAERLDPPGVTMVWAGECGLDPAVVEKARTEPTAGARLQSLLPLLKKSSDSDSLSPDELLPDWVRPVLPAVKPLAEWVTWFQKRPPLWLRIQHNSRTSVMKELKAAGLDVAQHATLSDSVRISTGGVNLYTLPAYQEGRVEIQDLASQLVGFVCAPAAGERWWDACAGGGGKSLHLARLMNGKGTVMATDVQNRNRDELRRRASRGGFQNIQARAWDGKPVRSKQATFDGVLVDAPCTCSGTWRRNPAMRWTSRRGEVEEMAGIQADILRNAASGVKPGGVLIYATCSFIKRENEDVVAEFLATHPEFQFDDFASPLTGEKTGGQLPVYPWDGDCDAMFMARMRRRENGVS